jgi:hypothetical protein
MGGKSGLPGGGSIAKAVELDIPGSWQVDGECASWTIPGWGRGNSQGVQTFTLATLNQQWGHKKEYDDWDNEY